MSDGRRHERTGSLAVVIQRVVDCLRMIRKTIEIFLLRRRVVYSSPIADFQYDKFDQEDISFNVGKVPGQHGFDGQWLV